MPAETWTSCDTSPKSLKAFRFRGFHARGPWYWLAAERSRRRLKGKRGRAHSHREGPWLSSPPARRARGTNLLRHNRTVHKQHAWMAEPQLSEGSERVNNKPPISFCRNQHQEQSGDVHSCSSHTQTENTKHRGNRIFFFYQIPTLGLRNIKNKISAIIKKPILCVAKNR